MTARQVWTIFCDGRNLHRPETPVGCGAWIGKEANLEEARQLARQNGWAKTGPDKWLCPRHRREAGRK